MKKGQILFDYDGQKWTVVKVGRKFLYVEREDEERKYNISDLRLVSNYGTNQLYLSIEQVERERNRAIYYNALRGKMHSLYLNPFSLGQLEAACKALDIEVHEFKTI